MPQPTDGREALTQIAIVCTDNMDRDCDHRMALDFVRQVATDALGALTSRVEAPVPQPTSPPDAGSRKPVSRLQREMDQTMISPSQPTTSEALAQNLEGYARDCIHIGSVESVNDLINAAAIIRDAIAAQPISPSVDGETLEALALSFVSIISDGRAHEASSKTIASMILNELFLRRAALSTPRVEPVADDFAEFPYDDERFNKGVQHVVELFAKTLGIDDWEAGDGSENYDDDLQQTLLNIMEARNIYDPETGLIGFASQPDTGVREALERIINVPIGYQAASQMVDIARKALAAPPAPPDAGREAADEIIGQIEARFPNWKSYRDLLDWIDCTLHALRGGR